MQKGKDRAYTVLRQRILRGHYEPGTQLKEEPLAGEFGISRTPLRSALRRLVEDGLATADAGQGIRVAEWSEPDIEETFQLRMLLEPYAASLAAVRGGGALAGELRASNEAMADAIRIGGPESVARIQDANRSFHRALLAHCGSPRLRAMLETMIDMPIIVRSFDLYTAHDLEQSRHQHDDLVLAVEARDGELARQVMQMHMRTSYLRFMRRRSEYRMSGRGGTDLYL